MLSNRHTDTQTKYLNPRCACAPRVKIGTRHERHPFHANGSEFADSAVSNVATTFRQCLSLIVNKKNKTGNILQVRPKILYFSRLWNASDSYANRP